MDLTSYSIPNNDTECNATSFCNTQRQGNGPTCVEGGLIGFCTQRTSMSTNPMVAKIDQFSGCVVDFLHDQFSCVDGNFVTGGDLLLNNSSMLKSGF